jgi:GNAT superfamily N-acetyltransferase
MFQEGYALAMARLIPDLALVRRIEAAESGYTVSRLKVLERLPGNPAGVAYRRDGRVLAMRARHLPYPAFNRVVGMDDSRAALVAELTAWFRDAGIRGRFDVLPGESTSELCRRLAAEGYAQTGIADRDGYSESGFHATLYGEPEEAPEQASKAVDIARVSSGDLLERFLDTYCDGWSMPQPVREGFKNNVRGWLGEPGWHLLLATIDGSGAGTAILYMHQGVGYFADGSTAPSARGRGVHQALLARRWQDARDAGAELVCSQAAYLSTSHRNMERAGLRLLHTQAIWMAPSLS